MVDKTKVAEAPVPEVKEVKAAEVVEPIIDNPRAAVENTVITANETFPEPESPAEEPSKEEPKVEGLDQITKIKQSVQKRIDKVIAKSKSVEEELAEAKAEIERLKSVKFSEPAPKDDVPPTIEQIEAYIIKMREEGDVKEEIAATRYLIKVEKEQAIKEVEERQNNALKQTDAQQKKQLSDWVTLSKDYEVFDGSGKVDTGHELTLSNQNGILYKTALALYNDKELHAEHYDNPDVIDGFRRAVADAYREIHQQGLVKTPMGTNIVVSEKRDVRASLAEPSAVEAEELVSSTQSNSLSDAEKVRDEIKARNKNRFVRR